MPSIPVLPSSTDSENVSTAEIQVGAIVATAVAARVLVSKRVNSQEHLEGTPEGGSDDGMGVDVPTAPAPSAARPIEGHDLPLPAVRSFFEIICTLTVQTWPSASFAYSQRQLG
jgi:hypothetical protein